MPNNPYAPGGQQVPPSPYAPPGANQPPPGYGPPMGYYPPPGMKPHRGNVVLTLGILGLVICVICGIIAWVMGNNDLKEMQAGTMDPSGYGLTNAGRICGMVGTILAAVVLVVYLVIVVAVVGATHGGG